LDGEVRENDNIRGELSCSCESDAPFHVSLSIGHRTHTGPRLAFTVQQRFLFGEKSKIMKMWKAIVVVTVLEERRGHGTPKN
jgi:hypothetical protein